MRLGKRPERLEFVVMQSENRIFDDFVKLVNGAAGTIAGMGREAEVATRERMREWIGGFDFVSREEFDAVKAMAAAARDDADALKARLDKLEGKAPAKPAAAKPAAAKTTAAPKPAPRKVAAARKVAPKKPKA
jgi:BMFP domain-containing protein YqiC